jgi:hypothetical protein
MDNKKPVIPQHTVLILQGGGALDAFKVAQPWQQPVGTEEGILVHDFRDFPMPAEAVIA